jgi:hypothetical protein
VIMKLDANRKVTGNFSSSIDEPLPLDTNKRIFVETKNCLIDLQSLKGVTCFMLMSFFVFTWTNC